MKYKTFAVLAAVAAGAAAITYAAYMINGRDVYRTDDEMMLGEYPGVPEGFGSYRSATKGHRPGFPQAV